MRKQYHFRDSERGVLIWDVDNLIRHTAGLSAIEVPLSKIRELDEPYWYELGGAVPTCCSIAEHMQLVAATDLSYPIIVCPEGRLMDGMHRVVKALTEGRESVMAYQLEVLPEPDYVDVAPDDLIYERS